MCSLKCWACNGKLELTETPGVFRCEQCGRVVEMESGRQ